MTEQRVTVGGVENMARAIATAKAAMHYGIKAMNADAGRYLGEFMEIAKHIDTDAILKAEQLAATPQPEQGEGEKVEITPGVYATDSEKWHTAQIMRWSAPVDLWWGTIHSDSNAKTCCIHPSGMLDNSGNELGRLVSITNRISDLPDARPEHPSPPAFALRAAEEIVRATPLGLTALGSDNMAAIIAREFEPVMKVVEAARKVKHDNRSGYSRGAYVDGHRQAEVSLNHLCELGDALTDLDAASKGGG